MDSSISDLVKTSQKFVGLKQTERGLVEGSVRCVVVARNADDFVINSITAKAKSFGAEVLFVEDKIELGKLCGIDVSAAVVGIVK